jgi:hypothetical protein
MKNQYRTSKFSVKAVIIIGFISFCVPILLSVIIKPKPTTPLDVTPPMSQTNIIVHTNNIINSELDPILDTILQLKKEIEAQRDIIHRLSKPLPIPEPQPLTTPMTLTAPIKLELPILDPEVLWLDSPVTQKWNWDSKNKNWLPVPSYKDSMRSTPSIIIGLRDDGVLIWKKVSN